MKQRMVFARRAGLARWRLRLPRGAGLCADVLPPHEILTIVRSTGLDPLDRPIPPRPELRGSARSVATVARCASWSTRAMARSSAVRPLAFAVAACRPATAMGPTSACRAAPSIPRACYVRRSGRRCRRRTDRPTPVVPAGRCRLRRVSAAPLPREPYTGSQSAPPLREPRVITAIPESELNGPLPPPPERFQPRPLPPGAAKPAPPKRAAAVQTTPPLPKPRPEVKSAPEVQASPAPSTASPTPPAAAENKPTDDPVPH